MRKKFIEFIMIMIMVVSFIMTGCNNSEKATTRREQNTTEIKIANGDEQDEILMKPFVFSWGYNDEISVSENGNVVVDVWCAGDESIDVEYGFMFFFNGKAAKCIDENGNETYLYTAIAKCNETISKKITVLVDSKYFDSDCNDFRTIAVNFPNYKVNENTYSFGNYGKISQFGGKNINISAEVKEIIINDKYCELLEGYKDMYRISVDSKYFNTICSDENQLENEVKLKMNNDGNTTFTLDGIGKGEYYLTAYVNGQPVTAFDGNESIYVSVDETKMAKISVELDRNEYSQFLNDEGYGAFYIVAVPKNCSYDVFKCNSYVIN